MEQLGSTFRPFSLDLWYGLSFIVTILVLEIFSLFLPTIFCYVPIHSFYIDLSTGQWFPLWSSSWFHSCLPNCRFPWYLLYYLLCPEVWSFFMNLSYTILWICSRREAARTNHGICAICTWWSDHCKCSRPWGPFSWTTALWPWYWFGGLLRNFPPALCTFN